MTIEQLFGHDTSNVSEDHFEKVFGGLLEGVMGGLDNECRVVQSAPAAMTVEVMTGTFVTGGVFARVSAQELLVIPANGSGNPRIDRVVCRRDNATDLVTVYILAGTPAGAPVPTALTRAGGIYEISLAQVYVANGAISITRANIADERRSRLVCGLISPNGSPDAMFPWINNPGQMGMVLPYDNGLNPIGLGLLEDISPTGVTAAGLEAGGCYSSLTSGAAPGNDAGWRAPSMFGGVTIRALEPALRMKWRISATTSVRAFCGLTGTNLAGMVGADAPAGAPYVGVQYSTDRGDTTWQFVAADGVAQTIVDSEVAVTTDPFSLLILADEVADLFTLVLIDLDGNVVGGCTFDDALDNVPAGNILGVMMGLETRAAATKAIVTYACHLMNRIT